MRYSNLSVIVADGEEDTGAEIGVGMVTGRRGEAAESSMRDE